MDAVLPFACPSCGLRSVAVGICPECRMELVAQAARPEDPAKPAVDLPGAHAVLRGSMHDCREAADLLLEAGIPASIAPSEALFQVLVPEGMQDGAYRALGEDWDREAGRLGHEIALEAQGLCPACGDPVLPEGAACPSCGIALA